MLVDDRGRIERIPYVLVVLRDAVRRREIYVAGGNRWRNPEDDLPGDFAASSEVHYAALRRPTDPTAFTTFREGNLRRSGQGGDSAICALMASGTGCLHRRDLS